MAVFPATYSSSNDIEQQPNKSKSDHIFFFLLTPRLQTPFCQDQIRSISAVAYPRTVLVVAVRFNLQKTATIGK